MSTGKWINKLLYIWFNGILPSSENTHANNVDESERHSAE